MNMSLLRSSIAFQDWLSTKMPLLTELPATARTREVGSPVRGEIFVGSSRIEIPKLRQEQHRVQLMIFVRSIGEKLCRTGLISPWELAPMHSARAGACCIRTTAGPQQ